MKPMLAPPRHSSTPTCTRSCADAPNMKTPRQLAAIPARTSERGIRKLQVECVMRATGESSCPMLSSMPHYFTTQKKAGRVCGDLSPTPTVVKLPVPVAEADRLEIETGEPRQVSAISCLRTRKNASPALIKGPFAQHQEIPAI